MRKIIVALMFVLFIFNIAEAKVSKVIDLEEWKKSTSYLLSSKMSNVKSDKFSDGIFDCEDWVKQYNEWWISRNTEETEEIGITAIYYELKGKKYGHALSFVVGIHESNETYYMIVDAQTGYGIVCSNLVEIRGVCSILTAYTHYFVKDKEVMNKTVNSIFETVKVEFWSNDAVE